MLYSRHVCGFLHPDEYAVAIVDIVVITVYDTLDLSTVIC